MSRKRLIALCLAALTLASCGKHLTLESPAIVGAWRSNLQFTSGPFAEVKDLEFMYVMNAGGTLMESSNYDAMPPVPPAYGTWRPAGLDEYELRYEYFATKPPTDVASIATGGGWLPNGRGVLTERIKLSADRQSFTSKLSFQMLDAAGKPIDGGGEADGKGVRMGQ